MPTRGLGWERLEGARECRSRLRGRFSGDNALCVLGTWASLGTCPNSHGQFIHLFLTNM